MSDAVSCSCQVEDRHFPSLLFDNICRTLFRPPQRFLAKHLSRGMTAADLGCGPGYFTVPMAKIVGEAGRVYGVDFDPKAVARLTKKAERKGVAATVKPQAASAAAIDFIESESVDFVLAEGLLCCMKDHEGAMRQIKRILKPGGRAYLTIVKFVREDDPRTVSKEEWATLLAEMELIESGEGPVMRWALVALKQAA